MLAGIEIKKLQDKTVVVDVQLTSLEATVVDENDLRTALEAFTPIRTVAESRYRRKNYFCVSPSSSLSLREHSPGSGR